jgi:flagellar hook-length control protein FliK
MLTIHANPPRSASNESTHAGGSSATPQDPAGFASLLRQSQSAQPVAAATAHAAPPLPPIAAAPPARPEPATAQQPAAAVPDSADAPDTDDASAHDAVGRQRAVPRSKSRSAPDAAAPRDASPRAVTAIGGDEPRGEAAADAATHTTATAATTIDPGVLHWLAGLQREAPTLGKAAGTSGTTATDAAAAAAPATMRDAQPAPLDARDGDAKDKPGVAADTGHARIAAVPNEAAPSKPAPDVFAATKDTVIATPIASAIAPPMAPRHEAPAPVTVALATPVNAPEFPKALGLQLSVFARDGIEHAELQLNPAEMGPVSVRITMDGTQARVDFGADVAATRHAIEAGLPELASALRDAGFTLAGGGVSQHSQGRSDRGDPSGRGERREPASNASAGADDAPRATRTTVRLGGLDLYA